MLVNAPVTQTPPVTLPMTNVFASEKRTTVPLAAKTFTTFGTEHRSIRTIDRAES